MAQSLKTSAFVLKKRLLLNRDLVVVLFTQNFGKIGVFARGARTITSRRGPHLETGNLINVILHKRGERYFLNETSLVSGFSQIKNDRFKVQALYNMLFVFEKILPEEVQEEILFREFKFFLKEISEKGSHREVLDKYLNKTLMILGYSEKPLEKEKIAPFIEELIGRKLPLFDI